MKLLLTAAVATTACGSTNASLSNHVAAPATRRHAACSESRLRALAKWFPGATLDIIEVTVNLDERGSIAEPCSDEPDAACVARARRRIPPGFVEVQYDDDNDIGGDWEWQATLDVEGKIVIENPRFALPAEIIEAPYHAAGLSAKLLSMRLVPTPEKRQAFVRYGYRRRHREATLTLPPMTDREFAEVPAVARKLGLHKFYDTVGHSVGSLVRWRVHYTCERYDEPTPPR